MWHLSLKKDLTSAKLFYFLFHLIARLNSTAISLSLSFPCPVEVDDFGIPHKAIDAFASLGSAGSHPGNEERDLHRWMRNLWGLTLEPYTIYCDLEVLCLHLLVLFFSSNRILSGRPWVV